MRLRSIKSNSAPTDSVRGSFRFRGSKSKRAAGTKAAAATPSASAPQAMARLDPARTPSRVGGRRAGRGERGRRVNRAGSTVMLAKSAMNIPTPAISPSSARPR